MSHSAKICLLPIILGSIVASGCSFLPTANYPLPNVDALPAIGVPARWQGPVSETTYSEFDWVQRLNDPRLSALLEEASSGNPDINALAARVGRAQEQIANSRARSHPNGVLSFDGQRGDSTDAAASSTIGAFLQTNWELDLWGRLRLEEAVAAADADALQFDFFFARKSLSAAVSRAYFRAVEANLQYELAQENVGTIGEIANVVTSRFGGGFASSRDVAVARSDVASAESAAAAAYVAKQNAARTLEILLGRYPSGTISVSETLPELPPLQGAGLPSELVGRRDDVIASEQRLLAQLGRFNVAEIARRPSFSLTSGLGASSEALSTLLTSGTVSWSAGLSAIVSAFDGGAAASQVRAEEFSYAEAIYDYRRTVLLAFAEVEGALDLGFALEQQEQAERESEVNAREALRLAQLLYREGEANLIDVLSVRQRLSDAQRNLLSVRRRRLDAYVELILALGKG